MRLNVVRTLSRAQKQQGSLEKKRYFLFWVLLSRLFVWMLKKDFVHLSYWGQTFQYMDHHVTKVQNALASRLWAMAIYADSRLHGVITCSTERRWGFSFPDFAVVMESVAWDLLWRMRTVERSREPRVQTNPMFQYFFFWLAWTILPLLSLSRTLIARLRWKCLSWRQTWTTWKPFPGIPLFQIMKEKKYR